MGVCLRSSPPDDLRMVLRTSLGIIIVLTLLMIIQGSIPKMNTAKEVTGDDLNVDDFNIAMSSNAAGIRDIVKRNANPGIGKKLEENKEKIKRRNKQRKRTKNTENKFKKGRKEKQTKTKQQNKK